MSLRARLEADETVYTAWSAIPDPLIAELLARAAYDAVTLDMQHGGHSTESILRGVAAVTLAGKPAIVRVPVGRNDMASRALDFGAAAVIAPMVNSREEARAFAAAMKFPPTGERSWGPTRTLTLHRQPDPQAYLRSANRDTLAIAMVETRAALAALDEILGFEGIDGVFVGPSDFSIAFSDGARVDAGNAEMLKAAEDVARRTRAEGKVACAFAMTPDAARRFRDMGFRLIAVGSDWECLARGAASLLAGLKG
ncbi:MAG: HpcH/HpaI aldolase family protein [Propylenella sp.]